VKASAERRKQNEGGWGPSDCAPGSIFGEMTQEKLFFSCFCLMLCTKLVLRCLQLKVILKQNYPKTRGINNLMKHKATSKKMINYQQILWMFKVLTKIRKLEVETILKSKDNKYKWVTMKYTCTSNIVSGDRTVDLSCKWNRSLSNEMQWTIRRREKVLMIQIRLNSRKSRLTEKIMKLKVQLLWFLHWLAILG